MMQSSFDATVQHLQRTSSLQEVQGLLGWDEQVFLPENATEARAEQMAAIADAVHGLETSPKLGKFLDELNAEFDSLDPSQRCIVIEARKQFEEARRLTPEFVARRASATSRAYHAWADAREKDDFAAFAPFLQEQIDLACEYAELVGATDAYDFCIDKHDPGMTATAIAALFEPLRDALIPLVKKIADSGKQPDVSFLKGFGVESQEGFLKEIVSKMGFDFTRGRIDKSLHPFCAGSGSDIRMTTRFFEDTPLDSLFSSIHETGHGLYEQGLPYAWRGTALGVNAGMGVHESQSRLWENQIARSRPFWEYWEPKYRTAFPEQLAGVDSEQLYRAINAVRVIPIRVDSDEVTYNLHIMLRFNLEQRLFSGDLKVANLPEAWNALAEEYLGLKIENDQEGVLQDVHWSGGAFGYFPSYTLGNMLAAQIWYTLRADIPDIDQQIAEADMSQILEWLRTNVHAHGRRYPLMDLSRRAPGNALSHMALVRYLEERYLPLYA